MAAPDYSLVIPEAGNPLAQADTAKVFAKDVTGVTQLFALASDGTVTQLTPASAVPSLPLSVANGGTATSTAPTNGQLLIGNAGAYNVASLTAGSNIAITPGAGTLTIAATGIPAPWFGTGLDGALVFDGVSTVAGLVPVAGVYTLVRDLLPTTMVVQAGVRVRTAGGAIFASVSVLVDGILGDDGADAVGATAGSPRATTLRYQSGSAGGSAGSAGGTISNAWPIFTTAAAGAGVAAGVVGVVGAVPGQGGSGGGGTGASAGGGAINVTTLANSLGMIDLSTLIYGRTWNNTVPQFGSGGGSGGTGSAARGGGGGGGGCVCVTAPSLLGSGRISARGGSGGAAAAGGNAGGGGGGGGGLTLVVYNAVAGTLTIDAAGGAGGAGDGTGKAGGPGAAGFVWRQALS
jgi:hypothetical protein